jgi:hypothetical protein
VQALHQRADFFIADTGYPGGIDGLYLMGRPAYGLGSQIDRGCEKSVVDASMDGGTGTAGSGADGGKTIYLVHNGIK